MTKLIIIGFDAAFTLFFACLTVITTYYWLKTGDTGYLFPLFIDGVCLVWAATLLKKDLK